MIRFDDALQRAISVAKDQIGEALNGATIVRDVTGRISLVVSDLIPPEQARSASEALDSALGVYSAGPRTVLVHERDLIDADDVLRSSDRVPVPDERVFVVDRLLTNQDWVRAPNLRTSPVPLAVGYSIKGGVGRSTALAVWAWHLAREGRRVAVLDLDLEAPGIGSLLLDEPPRLGLIDWLAEDVAGQDLELDELLASSPVADGTPGDVMVVPAFGTLSRDYIVKLGRILLPTWSEADGPLGVADRLLRFVERLAAHRPGLDVVLIDARAGLHDLGAAAVTQLGAEAFLFNRDEPGGFAGYRHLFEHLRTSRAIRYGMPDDDLRWRLKMVGAQSGALEDDLQQMQRRAFELWATLYDEDADIARDDVEAPHFPIPIYFEDKLRGMRLVDPGSRPAWQVIESTFGAFLSAATARLGL